MLLWKLQHVNKDLLQDKPEMTVFIWFDPR